MSAAAPNIAVVYYSKSGRSRSAAEKLAAALKADLCPLRIRRYGMPFLGYLRAGMDGLRQVQPQLQHPLPHIADRDAVVICGPIWTSYPATPLHSYLRQAEHLPPIVGLLLTCGDHSPPEKAYEMAEQVLGRHFVAKASIPNGLENTPEAQQTIKCFVTTILYAISPTIRDVARH